jgi:hypothetical protein
VAIVNPLDHLTLWSAADRCDSCRAVERGVTPVNDQLDTLTPSDRPPALASLGLRAVSGADPPYGSTIHLAPTRHDVDGTRRAVA